MRLLGHMPRHISVISRQPPARLAAKPSLLQTDELLRPLLHPPDEALGFQEDRLDGAENWRGERGITRRATPPPPRPAPAWGIGSEAFQEKVRSTYLIL